MTACRIEHENHKLMDAGKLERFHRLFEGDYWKDWMDSLQSVNGFILASAFIGLGVAKEESDSQASFKIQVFLGALSFIFAGFALILASSCIRILGSIQISVKTWNNANVTRQTKCAKEKRVFHVMRILAQSFTLLSFLVLIAAVILIVQIKTGEASYTTTVFVMFASIFGFFGALALYIPNFFSR